MASPVSSASSLGGVLEVLGAFTKLGLSAFGGPIAHIGYFRTEFVERRRWLDERAFADLIALCQFLPGPASSQAGFALGLMRAGPLGGLAAWLGFTAPSAILMIAFAFGSASVHGPIFEGLTHGLKLVAVAIVAHAVFAMARSFASDIPRAAIALIAAAITLAASAFAGQVAAIAFGAAGGWLLTRKSAVSTPTTFHVPVSRRAGIAAFVLFVLLLGASVAVSNVAPFAQPAAFYRSGALVFGGGHVVLPLLQQAVVAPHWAPQDAFLSGYGAAQALPGPLFTFAAYLGAIMQGPWSGLAGAVMALCAIFLPGLLVLIAALPFWNALRQFPWAQAIMSGANAAVVGVLGAALYTPVWTSAVRDAGDMVAAAAGFVLLVALRVSPLLIVLLGACYGMARAFWS